jgi:hypothetical protein
MAHFLEALSMNKTLRISACIAALGLIAAISAMAIAETKDSDSAGQPQLPPGFTEEDMKACILAATPNEKHTRLTKEAGVWHGKTKMWMTPGAEPTESECTSTVTPLMDGRFTQVKWEGDMPGMGPYNGLGIFGYDNVAKEYVSMWLDNHGTGIMTGTGEASDDGKTITWNFTFNCPLKKGPAKMREVETITGPNTKTLDMYGEDPKSGKEYKMMSIELTKKESSDRAGG